MTPASGSTTRAMCVLGLQLPVRAPSCFDLSYSTCTPQRKRGARWSAKAGGRRRQRLGGCARIAHLPPRGTTKPSAEPRLNMKFQWTSRPDLLAIVSRRKHFPSQECNFGPATRLEFPHNVSNVCLYCALAHLEIVSDALICFALLKGRQHGELPTGEHAGSGLCQSRSTQRGEWGTRARCRHESAARPDQPQCLCNDIECYAALYISPHTVI